MQRAASHPLQQPEASPRHWLRRAPAPVDDAPPRKTARSDALSIEMGAPEARPPTAPESWLRVGSAPPLGFDAATTSHTHTHTEVGRFGEQTPGAAGTLLTAALANTWRVYSPPSTLHALARVAMPRGGDDWDRRDRYRRSPSPQWQASERGRRSPGRAANVNICRLCGKNFSSSKVLEIHFKICKQKQEGAGPTPRASRTRRPHGLRPTAPSRLGPQRRRRPLPSGSRCTTTRRATTTGSR